MFRYLPEFIQSLTLRGLTSSSISQIKSDLALISEYLSSPLRRISQAELEKALYLLKCDRSLKEVSLNRKISSCRSFFSFLHQRGYISENPAENLLSARRIKGAPAHLSKAELHKLLQASEGNFLHHTVIHTYYELGLRLSELINLQISDVDSSAMKMRVMGKGRKVRYVAFGQALLQKLRQVVHTPHGYRTKGYLFLQPDFSPLTPSYVQQMVKHYVVKAGIRKKVSPKTLRHSHGTHSLSAGIDLFRLQKTLGHSNLSSTRVYTHLEDSTAAEANERLLEYAFG